MGLIYKIQNKINGHIYIGKTSRTLNKRWQEHVNYALAGGTTALAKAIKKYGKDNFELFIVEDNIDNDLLNEKEKTYINFYQSNNSNIGYNETDGGDGGRTSSKLSQAQVSEIIKLIQTSDIPLSDIARMYNIHKSIIININNGKTWVQDNLIYPLRTVHKNYQSKLTDQQYIEIIELLKNTNQTLTQIAKSYNLSEENITSINQGYYCYGADGYYGQFYNGTYPIRDCNKKYIKQDDISDIIYDILFTNDSMEKIGNKYGEKGNTITYIALGKRRKELTQGYKIPLRKYKLENQLIYKQKNGGDANENSRD